MENNTMSQTKVLRKLLAIQTELKAPKTQFNDYGKYKYRNAEQILDALKPLLAKNSCTLVFNDEIVTMGDTATATRTDTNDSTETKPSNYVKTTAYFFDCDSGENITASAVARESSHKGMSGDQCTGTASSYARKYCLNGLFLIDDGVDSDSLNKGDGGGNSTAQNAAKPSKSWGQKANTPQPQTQQSSATKTTSGWGSKATASPPNNSQPQTANKGWGIASNKAPSQPAKANTGWGKPAVQNNETKTDNQTANAPQAWGKNNADNTPSQTPANTSVSAQNGTDFSEAEADDYPF